jgi:hypothetical protein
MMIPSLFSVAAEFNAVSNKEQGAGDMKLARIIRWQATIKGRALRIEGSA